MIEPNSWFGCAVEQTRPSLVPSLLGTLDKFWWFFLGHSDKLSLRSEDIQTILDFSLFCF